MIKFRNFVTDELLEMIMIGHNENIGNANFTKLTNPIFRVSYTFTKIVEHFINKLIPDLSLLLTVFGYFILNFFNLGLIFLFGNIIIIIYILFTYKNIYNESTNLENIFLEKELNIIETFNNLEKIICKGGTDEEINGFLDNSLTINKYGKTYNYVYNLNSFILNILCYSIIIISIFYSIYLFKNKNIEIGVTVTIITITIMYRDIIIKFFDEIPYCIDLFARIETINVSFLNDLIKRYYDTNSDNYKNKIQIKKIKNIPHIKTIKYKNISFMYENKDKLIFNNLNLEINVEDKIIGIIGDSGFGKSTLMKILIKLYKYDGSILINDVDIKFIDTKILREKITYVNQSSKLFDKKIIKNITYGLKNNDSYKFYLSEIMKFDKINRLFANINLETTDAGFSGDNLSGGQRQVVNLINGLIQESDIIILDEPTNALNHELKIDVIKMIKYFKKYKKSIFIISHDKEIYSIFDDVINVNNIIAK